MKKMSTKNQFEKDFYQLKEHYSRLVEEHGDSPLAVQMTSLESQERRLEILTQVVTGEYGRVLDFGCGTGELYNYINNKSNRDCEYVGYDISPAMISLAQEKFPEVKFDCRDILRDDIDEEFEYIFVSGVFNNLMSDNQSFMEAVLSKLYAHTGKALAFNGLSTYVDYFDEGLYYTDPSDVFQYCKENLSPCVTLKHDYLVKPGVLHFDYTIYVYKTDIEPRMNNSKMIQ